MTGDRREHRVRVLAWAVLVPAILAGASGSVVAADFTVVSLNRMMEYQPPGLKPPFGPPPFEPKAGNELILISLKRPAALDAAEAAKSRLIDDQGRTHGVRYNAVLSFTDGSAQADLLFEPPRDAVLLKVTIAGATVDVSKAAGARPKR